MADNRGETKLYGQVGFEVMDPTPHKKVRGDVAGQVSPPAKKKVPTPLALATQLCKRSLPMPSTY